MAAIRMQTDYFESVQKRTNQPDTPSGLLKIMSLLGMPQTSDKAIIELLPFSDVIARSKTELQTAWHRP